MEKLIRFASNISAACYTIYPQAIISAQDKPGHRKAARIVKLRTFGRKWN